MAEDDAEDDARDGTAGHGPPPATRDRGPAEEIAPGVLQIDTRLGGWDQVTAGYLVTGEAPVLVETGSQTSVPELLRALEGLGIDAAELAGIVVTHIHLDHAGGVGDVAAAFPDAMVYVHERGARHLADPRRLVDSAAQVYGDLLDSLYGRLAPTAADRIRVLGDGEDLDVSSNRTLTCVDSPGHARHHLALHDSGTGLLFAGDAVGVRLPDVGVLRPATPPPDFDLDQALDSLRRLAARHPTGVALAHFGLVPDAETVLEEATDTLRRWGDAADAAWRQGRDIAGALAERFGPDTEGADPELVERMETLNGIHSNAAGLRRWLERCRSPGDDTGHAHHDRHHHHHDQPRG